MAPLRLATIGTSMITDQLLKALPYVEGVTFAGAYSRSSQKAKDYSRSHGASAWWDSLDELAQDPQVDAVYIASPNICHFEQAMQMVEAGKHVLVEKPLCSTLVEAEKLFAAAKANGVCCMEAMRLAHDPAYEAIYQALPKLGTIRRARFAYGKYSSRYDLVLEGTQTNIFDPALATGALMDLGVYPINALVLLFGEPDDLMAFADTVDVTGNDDLIDICGSAIFDYPSMIGEVSYSKATDDLLPTQIEGEKGTMLIHEMSSPSKVEIVYRDGAKEELSWRQRKNPTTHEVSNLEFELQDFVNAAAGELDLARFTGNTLVSLGIMDTIRLREGIVFPHDEEE